MQINERTEQLKQLGIFAAVIGVLVIGLFVINKFVKKDANDYQRVFNTKVGETLVLNMPGKVSIEYRWQINKELSKGLKLLDIEHIGWRYDQEEKRPTKTARVNSKFGTPRTAKFVTTPRAPGDVFLRFEFKRRGIEDDQPIRMREISIKITK